MKEYPLASVASVDTAMELTCAATRWGLIYLREEYGESVMQRLACETRMNLGYIMDAKNWVSLEYYYRFLDGMVDLTGNPNAPFDAALYASRYRSAGVFETLFTRLGTVAGIYRLFVKFSSQWNRVAEFSLLKSTRSSCVLSVRYHRHKQHKLNCLSIQGALASMPLAFGLPLAQVEESECACDGHSECVYHVRWQNRPRRVWGSVGFVSGLAAGAIVGSWAGWNEETYSFALIVSCIGYFWGRQIDYSLKLKDVYRRHDETAASLEESISATEMLNEELQHRVEERTDELFRSTRQLERALNEIKESRDRELIAEKQAAIGVLAGGTAHEINNPLNAVSLCIQSLREDITDEALLAQIELAGRATRRCKRIVNDLLSLSREPQLQGAASLERIAREVLMLFAKEDAGSIEIRTAISHEAPPVMVDRMQIQQSMLNLLKNASDAMDGSGVIDVSLDTEGDEVVLSVSDHGPGIREEDRKKIFDPFFTTKRTGKGMGLGLSITYQLVQRNGGRIEVAGSEGGGASFRMIFPVSRDAQGSLSQRESGGGEGQ